ncbi:putative RNA-directed DNA polymerase from transposon BS [Araneus ventricosus]|uniref:Putative RNA-directed DNA polymerase from transposon BS n=1 Tax=Araneus ventricosus TaxID=182803 RepID=A0A4Y2DIN5_ARAVE|nr:putative RNA-directed DNA polymerase from transposon BS [Araneus ventricosus]
MEIDVSTDLIWGNISARFLVVDIPTTTPLEELSKEIQDKNDCLVVEMRRFVKPNSGKVTSPVLITILGTTVPETIKLWFIRQRIQPFVDRPRQCNKCFVYTHGARTCDKNNICFCCGGDHTGACQQPLKCVNCSGSHNAKSRSCPVYIQEQKILELKCRNHITIGEARRIFRQKNANYAESVKTLPAVCNIEESINAKFESLLKTVNDRLLDLPGNLFKEDDNLSHPNKIFFRTHRSNRLGGGLLIGIPKNISGRVIYSIENDPNQEVLAVEIHSKNLNFIIINIYAPHGFNIASIKRFLDSLSIPTFIFGDFNLHHPLWGGSSQSSLSESFVDWLNNSDFSMLNTSAPTHISNPHTSSIIDLTLCSASIYNEIDCYVFDCTFESDHIPIVISWSKFQNTTRSIKTINWKPIITKSIEIFNTTSQPNIDLITDHISRTISGHTSNKILVDKDYPPWWNAACHNFSHLKKLAWNKARRSIATTEWIKYKKYRMQPIPLDYSTENEFLNRNIEFWELKRAISKTKNSTPGADNIPSIWFKNLDDASLLKILGLLQQQLDFSALPKVWKHTIIIPIPKPNKDKTKLTSYRPIALTSVFCKIFERILAHRITHFLTSQKKLNPNQHGFLPFRDNHTAIYKIYSAIFEARKNKKFFVAVSLDIKSAYDSVHVDDLILKCLQLGISGKAAKWMHHFLQERSFQIKWRNFLSNTKTSFKGLPQGSVLSPILYVIFMNDFFETLDNNVQSLPMIFLFIAPTTLYPISKLKFRILWNIFINGAVIGN